MATREPRRHDQAPDRRRAVTVTLWIVQTGLAVTFTIIGVARLSGSTSSIATFDDIGLGQWFRYVTGCVELAGGLGLLIPGLAGPAALGLAAVMAGATVANLVVLTPAMALLTVALGTAFVLVARARWTEISSLARQLRR